MQYIALNYDTIESFLFEIENFRLKKVEMAFVNVI